ncbi:hypothetical protein [Gloeobacter violaceus]|uniref:Glr1820 protein n=1 Tax=Gloeobacter violaceus (strain ATCC 29082 / PCC 7421) TaxID=251221 RepID=Q7NJL2_GLOVI|nr:hypothetical protein [Gloeobacter violaceus]BAC89761.1 glr1820 [Gloeobacter violaceus PCC 7421]
MSDKLDTTLNAFRENIATFAVGKAVRNIEAWRKDLLEAGPEFEEIAGELEKLEGLLKEEQVDGKSVGKLLGKLSKGVKKVAKGAESGLGDKLEELSQLMDKAAKEDIEDGGKAGKSDRDGGKKADAKADEEDKTSTKKAGTKK